MTDSTHDITDQDAADEMPFVSAPVDIEVLSSGTELVEAAKNSPVTSPQNKATRFRTEISDADKKLFDKLPTVIDKLVEKALAGKGDTKLLMYVVDRCLGRPTEHQEISATAEWRAKVTAEYDHLKEVEPDELVREYNQTIGAGA